MGHIELSYGTRGLRELRKCCWTARYSQHLLPHTEVINVVDFRSCPAERAHDDESIGKTTNARDRESGLPLLQRHGQEPWPLHLGALGFLRTAVYAALKSSRRR